jgi:hypothetical protein
MDYKISDLKLKNSFFNYLNSTSELNVESNDSWMDGATPYYLINGEYFDDLDYEPSPIVFVYYPNENSYDFRNTYNNDEFPLIELDYEIYSNLINMFGEVIVHHYMPEWISNKIGESVKNVFSE